MEQKILDLESQIPSEIEGMGQAVVAFPTTECHLRPGSRIEILEGPFSGFDGEVRFVDTAGDQLTASVMVHGKDVFIPLKVGQVRRR